MVRGSSKLRYSAQGRRGGRISTARFPGGRKRSLFWGVGLFFPCYRHRKKIDGGCFAGTPDVRASTSADN